MNGLIPGDFTKRSEPFSLFADWLAEAKQHEINDPNAMALATVDASGLPDARMVLLKGHDPHGFVFYTNSQSAKGTELASNMQAALLFHWKSLRRQIRIRGSVEIVTAREADEYYASRPLLSRIGAWASEQSRPLADRATLEAAVAEYGEKYHDAPPRPPHWLGYRIRPLQIEFWHDGPARLHDRVLFSRAALNDPWQSARLYP
ncbi:MAG: pyridoxamine 5'-phosphate oxidase [Hyphomicrobiales bacterium]|nr:pyridoxamine 5'-phosphate oxidase [Hyphomicrobiales bacterium]